MCGYNDGTGPPFHSVSEYEPDNSKFACCLLIYEPDNSKCELTIIGSYIRRQHTRFVCFIVKHIANVITERD